MNPMPALAVLQHGLGAAVREVVEVLNRGDRRDRPGRLDLGHEDLRQPDASDLARRLQFDQGAELVGEGDVGIDAVQLEELDALEAEQAEALLGLGLEVLRSSVALPAPGAGRVKPALVAMTRSAG
jgi:hypothetical protein